MDFVHPRYMVYFLHLVLKGHYRSSEEFKTCPASFAIEPPDRRPRRVLEFPEFYESCQPSIYPLFPFQLLTNRRQTEWHLIGSSCWLRDPWFMAIASWSRGGLIPTILLFCICFVFLCLSIPSHVCGSSTYCGCLRNPFRTTFQKPNGMIQYPNV